MLNCKKMVEQIDFGEVPTGLYWRLRWRLHFIICKPCLYYFQASEALSKALRQMVLRQEAAAPIDMKKLNHDLIQKHSQTASKN